MNLIKSSRYLRDFLAPSSATVREENSTGDLEEQDIFPPYISEESLRAQVADRSFFVKSYGCQMNDLDTRMYS